MKERAFDEVAAGARATASSSASSPRAGSPTTGELDPFRPGVARIVDATPVPVMPMALRGLWGSFFSRAATARRCAVSRGVFSRIALVAAPAGAAGARRRPSALQATVLALRGDRR